jgi:putative transposase
MGNEVRMTKRQIIEEPCEGKLSSTVLKTSGTGDSLAEFNRMLSFLAMAWTCRRGSQLISLSRIQSPGCMSTLNRLATSGSGMAGYEWMHAEPLWQLAAGF